MNAGDVAESAVHWQEEIYLALKAAGIRQIPYVPDAGHAHVISRVHADPAMRPVVLTTEEEGIGVACGAWLGGDRAVLLMQSSGVGNCINMLSLAANCEFPLLTLVTMRGEWKEFNSWQCPMSAATETSLAAMGLEVRRCEAPAAVRGEVERAIVDVFVSDRRVALLLSQRLIGEKRW